MSVKYMSKLFLFTRKYQSWWLKFSNTCSFRTQFRTFSLSESTVTSNFSDTRPKTSFFRTHFEENQNKYCIVKSEDIDLTEETNFKSLELLKDFVRSSNNGLHETPENDTVSEELKNCIQSESKSYSLKDIFKYIILISKLRFKDDKTTLLILLNAELRRRTFLDQEHLQILTLCKILGDHIFYINDFNYRRRALFRLCEKATRLNPEQVVLLFYNMRELPESTSQVSKFGLQQQVLENVSVYNSDQLSIISNGFLKSKIRFSNKYLLLAIGDRIVELIEEPREIPFLWAFKLIGLNASKMGKNAVADFQKKMISFAEKIKGTDLMYLARTGALIQYVDLSLWEILANKFMKSIKNYSLWDIERMVDVTVVCNIKNEKLLKMALEEFESAENVLSSHIILINFLYNLIHHEIYPEKLLSLVLSKDFRLNYKPESFALKLMHRYSFINAYMEFQRPVNNFELFDDVEKIKFYKVFKAYPYHDILLLKCNATLKRLLFTLQDIYGEKCVLLTNFQPHFKKGIVMRFDRNLEVQPIPEEYRLCEQYKKNPLNDDHVWVFVMVFLGCDVREINEPNFETQTQIRALEANGYVPVLIHNYDFRKTAYKETHTGVKDFLEDILKKKVQEVLKKKTTELQFVN